jgi:hypothetical protein
MSLTAMDRYREPGVAFEGRVGASAGPKSADQYFFANFVFYE